MSPVEITAKTIKITAYGDSMADVEIELSSEGQRIGTTTIRVNRPAKEAEQIALEQAKRDAGGTTVLAPTPKAEPKQKPEAKE